ncbi:twin-arginine translocase TatA/TatE family subunit [Enemella evansiae]|uniref:Sec-independent protein translocase protein TatA n=1 Tax=Enemella evansiae TaxID=2016499 RepID=A0A255G0V9_9ACTN|nr:twin-arginine translocase TatA/TatE family subunit [Enemella evansiae]OYO00405.1 hypothetical protein CGZ96_04740 [Enemella evansiae]OYO05626.1 hypothetical protein CGZ97_02655 [Enemella evansiae]OYO09578.1 hypothetical protein CGZ94_18115 [Enemella evansiae]PFG66867.1 sec-independent protein translocase protein TatA [Propionibacteriaceae bacterium ES.041]
MTPMILGLGVPELLIILAVVLLLFGGSRLAGIGRSSGRAIREFKEETKGLSEDEKAGKGGATAAGASTPKAGPTEPRGLDKPATGQRDEVVDAEVVDRNPDDLR